MTGGSTGTASGNAGGFWGQAGSGGGGAGGKAILRHLHADQQRHNLWSYVLMALIPLKVPAGFYRNGTDLDATGRWRDGSLVRWRDGSLRPIGGWQDRKTGFSANPTRGMHSWEANDGTAWLAGGSHTELSVMTGSNTVYDVAPSDLATGRADAEVETGYGYGFYGTGFYGHLVQITGTTPRRQRGA